MVHTHTHTQTHTSWFSVNPSLRPSEQAGPQEEGINERPVNQGGSRVVAVSQPFVPVFKSRLTDLSIRRGECSVWCVCPPSLTGLSLRVNLYIGFVLWFWNSFKRVWNLYV